MFRTTPLLLSLLMMLLLAVAVRVVRVNAAADLPDISPPESFQFGPFKLGGQAGPGPGT